MAQTSQIVDSPPKSANILRHYEYSGPLPHPELLNKFDPKTRNTIVKMADRQSSHRQALEKKVIESNSRNEFLGMVFSLVITLTMMGVGAFLILKGNNVIGFLSIFAPAIFHANNYRDQRKREKKLSE